MISAQSLIRKAVIRAFEAGVNSQGLDFEKRLIHQERLLEQFFADNPIPEVAFLESEDKWLPPVGISSDVCAAHKWIHLHNGQFRCKFCPAQAMGRLAK